MTDEYLKRYTTVIKCDYKHCRVEVPVFEACTLEIERNGTKETYRGHRGCLEALNEELQDTVD